MQVYSHDIDYFKPGHPIRIITVTANTKAEALRLSCHMYDMLKALGYSVQDRPLSTLTVTPLIQCLGK